MSCVRASCTGAERVATCFAANPAPEVHRWLKLLVLAVQSFPWLHSTKKAARVDGGRPGVLLLIYRPPTGRSCARAVGSGRERVCCCHYSTAIAASWNRESASVRRAVKTTSVC